MNYSKNTEINNRDLQAECLQFMAERGLNFSGPIQADDKVHRFSADNNQHKPDEWYKASEGHSDKGNQYLICTAGSWSSGEHCTYQSWKNDNSFSAEDRKEFYEIFKKHQEETESQFKIQHNLAAKKDATKIWEEAKESPPDEECSRYAKLKGVDLSDVKFGLHKIFGEDKDPVPVIIIDFRNAAGEIRTIQFIHTTPGGKTYKQWLTGGEKKGNFHVIGEITDATKIYVVEGWATGVSVHMAIKAPVVVAGDAGNLLSVTENVRNAYPIYTKRNEQYNIIVIAGDSDERGKKDAISTAKRFNNLFVVFPKFPEDKSYNPVDPNKKLYTDFNDLHQACGLEEVKIQLINTEIVIPSVQDDLKNLAHDLLKKEEPCDSFSLSDLPKILADYISSICETTNAHPVMVMISVLGEVSAFFGKRVFIPESEYFQRLYPNLWMLCIAKSGQFKTTALNKGAKLALDKSNKVFSKMKDFQEDQKDKMDERELKKEIVKISVENPILPNKLTGEAFLEMLSQGHGGVILSSEFGAFLQNLDKNHNNDFKATLTDLYDVPGAFRYKTKTQGDLILNEPCFSIAGVSTLAWIKPNFKETDVTSGFFARFLIFTPPFKDEIPPALPERRSLPDPRIEQRFSDILSALDEMGEVSYLISEPAKKIFQEFHNNIHEMQRAHSDKCKDTLDPFVKRWSPTTLKLSIFMQYFINPLSREIGAEAIKSAITVILVAIKSTAQLFEGELGESEQQRDCRKLLTWICKRVEIKGRPVRRQEIFASTQIKGENGKSDYDKTNQALLMLCERGDLELNKRPGGVAVTNSNFWEYTPMKQYEVE